MKCNGGSQCETRPRSLRPVHTYYFAFLEAHAGKLAERDFCHAEIALDEVAVNELALAENGFAEVTLPERAAIKFLARDFLAARVLADEGAADGCLLYVADVGVGILHAGQSTLPSGLSVCPLVAGSAFRA